MKRKILSTFIALCLVLTLMPMTAKANGSYSFAAPDPVEVNGVTATVTFDRATPQSADSNIEAIVTLSGTATTSAVHTINLTSTKASLNGSPQTELISCQGRV